MTLKTRLTTNPKSRRRGNVAVMVAVSLVMLVGALALALDSGRLFDQSQQTRSAAEAAAMAGAIELYSANTSGSNGGSTARSAALAMAAANGYGNDGSNSVVTVNIPPKSGTYANADGFIEVVVQSWQRRGFSNVFGSEPVSVKSRAVAGGTTDYVPGSLLVLDPKQKKSLSLHKGGSQLIVKGAIAVNSKAKDSVGIEKSSSIVADSLMTAGNIDKKSRRYVTGDVFTKAPATPDPLAGLSPPDPGPTRKLSDYRSGDEYNLIPGSYKGELKFEHSEVVHMEPGIYFLSDGGLKVKGEASLIAEGVMIYNDSKKNMEFSSKGQITLSPPTSGPYKGIALFQNPMTKGKVNFKNDQRIEVSGTIYVPNGEVRFQKTDLTLSGDEGDEGDEGDDVEEDAGAVVPDTPSIEDYGSIPAQIIARKLFIDKKSSIEIQGTGLNLLKPLLTIVQ